MTTTVLRKPKTVQTHEVFVELVRPDHSDPENPYLVETKLEHIFLVNNGQMLGDRIRRMFKMAECFEGWKVADWWTPELTEEF